MATTSKDNVLSGLTLLITRTLLHLFELTPCIWTPSPYREGDPLKLFHSALCNRLRTNAKHIINHSKTVQITRSWRFQIRSTYIFLTVKCEYYFWGSRQFLRWYYCRNNGNRGYELYTAQKYFKGGHQCVLEGILVGILGGRWRFQLRKWEQWVKSIDLWRN